MATVDETLLSILGSIRRCPVCAEELVSSLDKLGHVHLSCLETGHGTFIVKAKGAPGSWRIEYELED